MGSNKTSLLLVMKILMLRKKCKARCDRYAQFCGVTLMAGIRRRQFPLRMLSNVFLICREEKPLFEMST